MAPVRREPQTSRLLWLNTGVLSWVSSPQITENPQHLSGSVVHPLFPCLCSAVVKDKDKQSFKLRAGMDKKIVIYIQQTSNKELAIER